MRTLPERHDRPLDGDFQFSIDLETIHVLHVDDDASFTDLTATFLEREDSDFRVTSVTDVAGALDHLETGTVDCIVSDYQMPGTDGIEFLERVREDDPDLPFILFTGKGSEEVAEKAISAGVTDYLQKERGSDQYTVLANRIENSVERTRSDRRVDELLSAIDAAREGISLLDEEGRFEYVNEAYADIYGYDRQELLGEHWEMLYPEGETEYVTGEILPNLPEDGIWRGETTMVRADGSEIVTDHTLSYTPAGLLVCTINVLSEDGPDPTGLAKNAIDALDDLLFFFDSDGTLQYWNDAVEEVTGYSEDELSSLTPAGFVREADRDRMTEYVRESRRTGSARIEVRLQRADGETIPYEFISKRVTDDGGNDVGRIGLGRNISERKEYEQRVERQNRRLEHFAEVLSHDLRNPLTVAMGRLDLFEETGERQHYETATQALGRMNNLVTDVLTLAQNGDRITLAEYEHIELTTVAENAWSLIRHGGATLDVEDPPVVEADASRLQQILENLFRNAIEHGSTDVSVRVGRLPDGFYVEDDGPGIPAAERESVFESGHSTKDDGTGFGLATVEQLVDAHDWTIRITESEDGGARFELTGVSRVET